MRLSSSALLEVVGGGRFGGGVPDFSDFTEERSAKGQEGGYGIGFLLKPFPGFLGVDSDLGKIGTEIMGGFFEGGKIKPELGSAIRLGLVFEFLALSLQNQSSRPEVRRGWFGPGRGCFYCLCEVRWPLGGRPELAR
jgi:hypothetical protein